MDFLTRLNTFDKPDAYNPYAAGVKLYGGGRSNPNQGPTGAQGQIGYVERDLAAKARKQALMNLMQQYYPGGM